MNLLQPEPSSGKISWPLVATIFFAIFAGLAATSILLEKKYENKIFPGVKIADVELGGLTKTQAQNIVSGKFKQTYGKGFVFVLGDEEKTIFDRNGEIFSLNLESIVNKAYSAGRQNSWLKKYLSLLILPVVKKEISLDYQFNKNFLREAMRSEFSAFEKPAKDAAAAIEIKNEKNHDYQISFFSAQSGEVIDYDEAIESLEPLLRQFKNSKIGLLKRADLPRITTEAALGQKARIEELVKIPKIELRFKDKSWEISWADFTHWIVLTLDEEEMVSVAIDKEMAAGKLQSIAQEINQPATNAKLQIKAGRAVEFQASQPGQNLDIEKNFQSLQNEILNGNSQIALSVDIAAPEIEVANTNEMGIKELVGVGVSNFSGSPANRRHNIGVGGAALNGILIEPNKEFSLVKALGEIDAEHGYKPELVIKPEGTVPEYGGGLCQIATTIFRAALQSGLKITARKNHAYRVSYYEPAGTDATIYEPWPDVRFINDTNSYILIQTKISGNLLIFEFWGAQDGRKIIFEGNNKSEDLQKLKPKIFNIAAPGPPKEIETTELKPGEKKQTEIAHTGADTVFYRTIIKPDNSEEKETWKSHYVPWQAVFLVGVEQDKKDSVETQNQPQSGTQMTNEEFADTN